MSAEVLNVEQLQLAEEHEKKAVALSNRVSERERLYIEAHYYLLVGRRARVIQTYESYSRLYPRDSLPEGTWRMLQALVESSQVVVFGSPRWGYPSQDT